jgi:diguanylate cyclase (GGDEF)-like protein
MSYTDDLTGLANKRYLYKRLAEEIGRANRYRRSLALIMFDLDDLKGINDAHGHLAGDGVLRKLGDVLQSSIRSIDVVARYGGDEFCVIMPESGAVTCEQFMSRLQQRISSTRFDVDPGDKLHECTISLGGAVYPDHANSLESLIYAADMALLQAKEQGRNRHLLSSSRVSDDPEGQ